MTKNDLKLYMVEDIPVLLLSLSLIFSPFRPTPVRVRVRGHFETIEPNDLFMTLDAAPYM